MRSLLIIPVAALALTACSSSSKPAASSATQSSAPQNSAATTRTATTSTATSSTATTAAALPDACTLLTTAEVSAALGVTVGDGEAKVVSAPLGGRECDWATPDAPISTFQLVLRSDDTITAGSEDAAALFDQTRTTFESTQSWTDLPGVGDKAYLGKSRAEVLKGSVLLDVSIGFRDQAVATKALTSLTTAAVGKL